MPDQFSPQISNKSDKSNVWTIGMSLLNVQLKQISIEFGREEFGSWVNIQCVCFDGPGNFMCIANHL